MIQELAEAYAAPAGEVGRDGTPRPDDIRWCWKCERDLPAAEFRRYRDSSRGRPVVRLRWECRGCESRLALRRYYRRVASPDAVSASVPGRARRRGRTLRGARL